MLNKKFKRVVEKYCNKVYNFYYDVARNHNLCKDLINEAFGEIYSFLIQNSAIEEYDIYKIAVDVLMAKESYFKGKVVYYDFSTDYSFQHEIEKDFNISMVNIDFCFFKLKLEDKIILILKHRTHFKDWEIAHILGVGEKKYRIMLAEARAQLLNLLL